MKLTKKVNKINQNNMENYKGAPAPWTIVEHSWSDTSVTSGGKTIFTISIFDEATEDNQELLEAETTATVNLIAAAPELLDALQQLAEVYENKGSLLSFDFDIARQAINKALGL